jgi:hypothetical protein
VLAWIRAVQNKCQIDIDKIDLVDKVDASRSVNPGIGDGGGKKHTDIHRQAQTDTDTAVLL